MHIYHIMNKRFYAFVLVLLALSGCGGGGSTTTGNNDNGTVTEPVTYSVSGTVLDELQQPVAAASVSVDGIQASALTNAQGEFAVQSNNDFGSSVLVTATKAGFDPFNAEFTLLSGSAEGSFTLETSVAMLSAEPWGFLNLSISANQNAGLLKASAACDCEVNISGQAYKNGQKQSDLYILLVLDVSGSTGDTTVGTESVFDIEVAALKGLLDNLSGNQNTYVGLIKFATEAEVVANFTNDLAFVTTALEGIEPETSGTSGAATNYQAALTLAKATFAAAQSQQKDIQTIAFLSDGIPTAPVGSGTTQEAGDRIASIEAAQSLADDKIAINAFPINIASELTTLPTIAAVTGGNYYQHDAQLVSQNLPNDSLVGISGIEMLNETTAEQASNIILKPDGVFSGQVCLTAEQANIIKITPLTCATCAKDAYQTIKVNCAAEQECSNCAGQVTNLLLQYTGTLSNATVKVTQRLKGQDVILIEQTLNSGDKFEFYGKAKDKTMGSDIKVYLNNQLNAEFVTSCGQPKIGPGRVSGDFLVKQGYSRNGGLLCPIE